MSKVESKVHEKYRPLYTSDKRYHVVTGGRGSGKSHSINEFLVRLTYEKGHGILFTRYTLVSAETSIIPEFKAAIDRLGVTDHFDITKAKITNTLTGSFIIFSGIKSSSGSQTARLKSLSGITTFVVEEAEDLVEEDEFDKIDQSVRLKGVDNRVILILNPTVEEHWIYQRWFKDSHEYVEIEGFKAQRSNHPMVSHIHTYYGDVLEYLDSDWIQNAMDIKRRDEERYNNVFLGGWISQMEGAVYKNWEIGEFNTSLPYTYGLDFGFRDPDALVKVAVDEGAKKIYLHQEIYENGLSTQGLTSKVMLKTKGVPVYCDSSAARSIYDLQNGGVNAWPAKKGHGSILEGIDRVKSYDLVVTESSTRLITELKNYIWADKAKAVPIDTYNHILDAVRYAVTMITKGTRSIWA